MQTTFDSGIGLGVRIHRITFLTFLIIRRRPVISEATSELCCTQCRLKRLLNSDLWPNLHGETPLAWARIMHVYRN